MADASDPADARHPLAGRWRKLGRRLALVGSGYLLLLALGFHLWTVHLQAGRSYLNDFVTLYVSEQRLMQGGDPYAPVPVDALGPVPPAAAEAPADAMHANLNPPAWLLLAAPLAWLPYAAAFWLLSLLSLAALLASGWLLARAWPIHQRGALHYLLPPLALALYHPTWAGLGLGQNALPLLLLLAAGWRLASAGRDRPAGLLLGLALALKPFTGLLLVLALLLGRRRLAAWQLVGFAAANLAALLALGPGVFRDYAGTLGGVSWTAASWNGSLFGLAARLFDNPEGAEAAHLPTLAAALPWAGGALVLGGLAWLAHRLRRAPPALRLDLGFGFALAAMLLLSPLGWMYYFPALLIAVVVVFRATRGLAGGRRFRLAAVLAWLLAGWPHMLVPAPDLASMADLVFFPGLYTASLATLCLTLALLARRLTVDGLKSSAA